MGFASTLSAGVAAVVTSATPAPAIDRSATDFDRSAAITTTFDADTERKAAQSGNAGAETSTSNNNARAVGTEPPANESAGSALLRRSRERENGTPPPLPKDPSAETAPTATTQPAAAQPVQSKPAAETPVSAPAAATQPATSAATEVKVSAATSLEKWKPLTQDQIEKLTPEQMKELLSNESVLRREAKVGAEVSAKQAEFHNRIRDVLNSTRAAGPAAQLTALEELRTQLGNEARENTDRARDLQEQRAGVARDQGRISIDIADRVRQVNERRANVMRDLGQRHEDLLRREDETWKRYKIEESRFDQANQELLIGRLPDFGGIFKEEPRPKSPKEAEEQRKKTQEEMGKVAIFDPYKEVRDPLKSPITEPTTVHAQQGSGASETANEQKQDHAVPSVESFLKPAVLEDVRQQILTGEPEKTPAGQRIALMNLTAYIDAASATRSAHESIRADTVQSFGPAITSDAVRAQVQSLVERKQELATTRAGIEYDREDLQRQRETNEDTRRMQYTLLDGWVSTEHAATTLAETNARTTSDTNWLKVQKVEEGINSYVRERQEQLDSRRRAKDGNLLDLGKVILGK